MGKLKLKIATVVTGHWSAGKIDTKDRRGREGGMAISSELKIADFPGLGVASLRSFQINCIVDIKNAYMISFDLGLFNLRSHWRGSQILQHTCLVTLRPPRQVLISLTYIVRFTLVDQYWLLVA